MRHAEFDREKVLRAAMSAFTVNGYAKTSMQDLTKATGLHPGSIYCAFDNKKGLLLAAIGQYQQDRGQQFQQLFTDENSIIDNLRRYLDSILQECLSCDASQSCLLTKTLSEMGEQDDDIRQISAQCLATWHGSLVQVFDSDCDFLAQYMMMGIYGMRTIAHTNPSKTLLQALADKLLDDLLRCD
jgi:TetR/AcrR family transcriptional repressor of nem operon